MVKNSEIGRWLKDQKAAIKILASSSRVLKKMKKIWIL